MIAPVIPVDGHAAPVPMLNGKVVFYIQPHTPMIDIKARQVAKLMLTTPLYGEADEEVQRHLTMLAEELSILLGLTQHIRFEYTGDDVIPVPVQAFREWWEFADLKPSPVVVFEQRCEMVSPAMMEVWNAAYKRGQLPFARDWHQAGDSLTPAQHEALGDPTNP